MLELSVQFGYVVMFAVGFPIAPFFVQLNNMVERKTDALKTLKMRRPRYRGATGIGSWLNVLEFLTVFSVVTNMLILFFSSSVTRDALGNTFSLTNVLLIVVFVEHLLFALKLGIAIGIDDVPRWVERARTRQSLRHRTESERSENERNKSARAHGAYANAGPARRIRQRRPRMTHRARARAATRRRACRPDSGHVLFRRRRRQ